MTEPPRRTTGPQQRWAGPALADRDRSCARRLPDEFVRFPDLAPDQVVPRLIDRCWRAYPKPRKVAAWMARSRPGSE